MTEQKNLQMVNQILRIIPQRIRLPLSKALSDNDSDVHEIVLRTHRPVCVYKKGEQYFIAENGCMTKYADCQPLTVPTYSEMVECFNFACGHSVYSHINEIKEGFITINGGHRVAVCGTAVVNNGEVTNIRDISTISIRFSREVYGCGKNFASELNSTGKGLLLCGSPCSGKTTVLRDIARVLSADFSRRVSLIDSRSEIASVYRGVNQKDVGMCDVLDSFPRAQGINQAVRTLSPEFVICDEIGNKSDVIALAEGVNSGVVFVATMHASSLEELSHRKYFSDIISTGAFENIVVLRGRNYPGQVLRSCTREVLVKC